MRAMEETLSNLVQDLLSGVACWAPTRNTKLCEWSCARRCFGPDRGTARGKITSSFSIRPIRRTNGDPFEGVLDRERFYQPRQDDMWDAPCARKRSFVTLGGPLPHLPSRGKVPTHSIHFRRDPMEASRRGPAGQRRSVFFGTLRTGSQCRRCRCWGPHARVQFCK